MKMALYDEEVVYCVEHLRLAHLVSLFVHIHLSWMQ